MLWIKAFHIIGVVVWFAGLLYLLRLYVYHAEEKERVVVQRFELMERRLYLYITVPGAYLTLLTGLALLTFTWDLSKGQGWIHVKLVLVVVLLGIHLYSGHLRKRFLQGRPMPSPVFFRVLNEIPSLLLIVIIILVVVKPF
jgi:putative membrane protein